MALSLITIKQYLPLLNYHRRCCEAVSMITSSAQCLQGFPSNMISSSYPCACFQRRMVTSPNGMQTHLYGHMFVWEYLAKMALLLKEWPSAEVVINPALVRANYIHNDDPPQCSSCKRDRIGAMAALRNCLAIAVGEGPVTKVRWDTITSKISLTRRSCRSILLSFLPSACRRRYSPMIGHRS